MFKSIVIAFAALLAMGPDRAVAKDLASERDKARDRNNPASTWAWPGPAGKPTREPVSEL